MRFSRARRVRAPRFSIFVHCGGSGAGFELCGGLVAFVLLYGGRWFHLGLPRRGSPLAGVGAGEQGGATRRGQEPCVKPESPTATACLGGLSTVAFEAFSVRAGVNGCSGRAVAALPWQGLSGAAKFKRGFLCLRTARACERSRAIFGIFDPLAWRQGYFLFGLLWFCSAYAGGKVILAPLRGRQGNFCFVRAAAEACFEQVVPAGPFA